MELSANAQTLHAFLVQTGGAWENKCIEAIYPRPEYVATLDPSFTDEQKKSIQTRFWQWSVNCYGEMRSYPVLGETVVFTSTANYSKEISAAYQELRKAGLADESNSGFNDYFFFPVKNKK